jgi:hypothetical protein
MKHAPQGQILASKATIDLSTCMPSGPSVDSPDSWESCSFIWGLKLCFKFWNLSSMLKYLLGCCIIDHHLLLIILPQSQTEVCQPQNTTTTNNNLLVVVQQQHHNSLGQAHDNDDNICLQLQQAVASWLSIIMEQIVTLCLQLA